MSKTLVIIAVAYLVFVSVLASSVGEINGDYGRANFIVLMCILAVLLGKE